MGAKKAVRSHMLICITIPSGSLDRDCYGPLVCRGVPELLIDQFLQIVRMGGDSNHKPTAMQSRSMARSQCWTTLSKRTGSLSAPDVNSIGNNQP